MAPEMDVPSSQKSSNIISTSTASLPQTGLDLALPQHLCSPKPSKSSPKASNSNQMASTWPWLNSWESWFQSPTSSQELGSWFQSPTSSQELGSKKAQ